MATVSTVPTVPTYFQTRYPDPEYRTLSETTSTKWVFLCPAGHTHNISRNAFLERIKGLNGTPPKYQHMCSVCEKSRNKDTQFEKWKAVCESRGFVFQSYDPSTRIVKYLCKCGESTQNQDTRVAIFTGCKKCNQSVNKLSLADVRQVFLDAGCTPLFETYSNNKEKLRYRCSCGAIGSTILHDFKQGGRCGNCKGEKTKETCQAKYGVDNVFQLQETKDKITATCRERYGVEHHSQHPEVQARKEASCLESHGVKTVLSLPEVQTMAGDAMEAKYGVRHGLQSFEVMEKVRQQNREKYGTDYLFSSEKFWNEWKTKNLEKYGVEFHTQVEEWKTKVRGIMLERYGSEYFVTSDEMKKQMLERYGVEHASQSKELREKAEATCLSRYGVRHPMQNYEVYRKAAKSMYTKKPYTLPSKKEILLMGYEWMAFDILLGLTQDKKYPVDTNCIYTEEEFELTPPLIKYTDTEGKSRVYYPDICVRGKIIEVKSIWTFNITYDRNHCKFKEAAKKYPFSVWIFGKKGLLEIITYSPDGSAKFLSGKEYTGKSIKSPKGTEDCEEEIQYELMKGIIEEM